MSSERALWNLVRERLAPFGRLERIENRLGVGFPDVLYCLRGVTGLLELKHEPWWSNDRMAGPVLRSVRSLKPEQVAWGQRWHAAGGHVYMLLQVERDYLLLRPQSYGLLLHHMMPRVALIAESALGRAGEGALPPGPLVKCLTLCHETRC